MKENLYTIIPSSIDQKHSHSPKTHHLALRSANTSPLQVPLSPILMIVSQTPPSPPSLALTVLSLFRINRRIFPLGAWIANLAGFSCLWRTCSEGCVLWLLEVEERVEATGPK